MIDAEADAVKPRSRHPGRRNNDTRRSRPVTATRSQYSHRVLPKQEPASTTIGIADLR